MIVLFIQTQSWTLKMYARDLARATAELYQIFGNETFCLMYDAGRAHNLAAYTLSGPFFFPLLSISGVLFPTPAPAIGRTAIGE